LKGLQPDVEDVVWGETLFSDQYGFAILKNLQALQAEQFCRTPEELTAVRDGYAKRMKEAKKQSALALLRRRPLPPNRP